MQAAVGGRAGLHRHNGIEATTRVGRRLDHRAAGLLGVAAVEYLLPGGQGFRAVHQVSPALERATKLAARHHLLAGVTTLLEVHAADRLVVEHLRHESLKYRLAERGHRALHIQPVPQVFAQRFTGGRRGGGGNHPQGSRGPVGGVQAHHAGVVVAPLRPRRIGQGGGHGAAGQAPDGEGIAGIAQSGFGAQHKHRQPLECGGQQVPAADQQDLVVAALEAHEAGLHAALGRAESRQARLGQAQQREIVRELAMKKLRGVLPVHLDHPQPGQPDDTV
ncbi:hypothetical protein FQZ97_946630 [compost metagenome]